MDEIRWSTRFAPALFVAGVLAATCGYSQEGQRDTTNTGVEKSTPLALADLPPPPPELAELIEQGHVTFVVGGRRPSEAKDVSTKTTKTDRYDRDFNERAFNERAFNERAFNEQGFDERGFGRRGPWGRRLSFDAETNFQVHLDYRSRCRWNIRWKDDQRHLLVTIRFSNLEVEPTHKIWLKHAIPVDQFWDSPLVRHEFDHVRLSVMVANPGRFASDLREHSTIDLVIDRDVDVNRAMVLPMVDKRVKERFAELLQLIEIRYQELDRQTRHGTRPLNRDSELFPMLREPKDRASESGAVTETDDGEVVDDRAGEAN